MLIAIQGLWDFSFRIQKTFSAVSFQSRSFIPAQFRSIRTQIFFNFLLFTKETHVLNKSNLISFLDLIVNLNTLKVFLGFRFRLKWVFRQYDVEVIEFWGFNVEREMKTKKHWKWFVFVANGKNKWMNKCTEWMHGFYTSFARFKWSDGSVSLGLTNVF